MRLRVLPASVRVLPGFSSSFMFCTQCIDGLLNRSWCPARPGGDRESSSAPNGCEMASNRTGTFSRLRALIDLKIVLLCSSDPADGSCDEVI